MTEKNIKPIPKYILEKIMKKDKIICPFQKGIRFYAYLAIWDKELVKVTVAVKNHYKKWYCKQVAVHGIHSENCYVKDMEYCGYVGMGYRVGWFEEGLSKCEKWFEDGWCYAKNKYYDPYTIIINPEIIGELPNYKYSAFNLYQGRNILQYLRIYEKYPQAEYLLKLGLHNYAESLTILKQIGKDKKFCRWLIANKYNLQRYYYTCVILRAYRTGRTLDELQRYEECKKRFSHDKSLKPLKELFKGNDLERFFLYIAKQNTNYHSYHDYLKACNYLGLDMTVEKNRFPKDFKRWHDIRIDEYAMAKALTEEKERAKLYIQFTAVAEKYISLQNCKKSDYAIFIAKSPSELIYEGEILNHCVGRMGYDQKMIREETLIFFVRDTEKMDIPFVTIEYSPQSKKILQCYGNGNNKPGDNVLQFVNKVWLPYANRTIKKLK